MLLRILSDIHMEHWGKGIPSKKVIRIMDNILPLNATDNETVLVLAGDISDLSCTDRFKLILEYLASRFKAIIYVQGNHEYYDGCFRQGQGVYQSILDQFDNVYYDYANKIDNIIFLCTTLWTDFDNEDPISMEQARIEMNDYKWIMNGERKLLPSDVLFEHKVSKKTLLKNLEEYKDETVIVVTHHAPSRKSIAPMYEGDRLNCCYANNLDEEIEKYKPVLWIHGHMHDSLDYKIGETRIICNPYGYHGHRTNRKFNRTLSITV